MKFVPNALYSNSAGGYIYTVLVGNYSVSYVPIGCSGIIITPPHSFSTSSTLVDKFTKVAESAHIPNIATITLDELLTYYPELFL